MDLSVCNKNSKTWIYLFYLSFSVVANLRGIKNMNLFF
eukprot:UN07818